MELCNNCPEKLHSLSILRAFFDKLISDEVAKKLKVEKKQTQYEQEEKAGKLLAWRIKETQTERSIASIKCPSGNSTMDPLK